ncbi:MAG: ATP cone domain-containing protein, partial [Nitrososphaeria archaeon]
MIRWVVKRDGRVEAFDISKLVRTLSCCLSVESALQVAAAVRDTMQERVSSHDLYRAVRGELWRRHPAAAVRFGLREDIMKLGPAGHNFEDFYARLLTELGYRNVRTRQSRRGRCVVHELDVVFEGSSGPEFAEMKYH